MEEFVCGLPLNESVTIDYDLGRMAAVPEWEQRAAFLTRILGDHQYSVTIDLGAGIGAVSAWAAQRSQYVFGFDLSKTHCLLYTFIMWQRNVHNAYIFRGTLDIFDGAYCPEAVDLIVAYNGLTRAALQTQCPHIGKYLRPAGRFLLVYPALFFGADDTSEESIALREFGLGQGWGAQEFPTLSALRLEATGTASIETDSLPFLAKMSNLPELFDFERDKPAGRWTGKTSVQLCLEYCLYKRLE